MDYDVKSELKEKRDILLGILRNDDDMPAFDEYNQGSYSMHLGVEPLDKEYDIDVGLRFHVNRDDYEPMDLKEKIRDLLKNHTEYGAKIKKPCVTVTYKKDGEAAYHVDLVTYVYEDKDDSDSQLYLARGKNRDSEETCWEKSDPVGLVEYVNDKYKGANVTVHKKLLELDRILNKIAADNKIKTGLIVAKDLENLLFELDEDSIIAIVGLPPRTNAIYDVDYDALNEVVNHILNLPAKNYTDELYVPDFDEKIKFNGLSKIVARRLDSAAINYGDVEVYFENQGDFLRDDIKNRFKKLYDE